MSSFLDLAKEGYKSYTSATGSQEVHTPHPHPDVDHQEAVKTAHEHGSGESSLFSTAMDFMSSNKEEHEKPLDEKDVQEAHKKAYVEKSPSSLNAESIGVAAALQALKEFTSGSASSSGGSSTKLIGLAMAEATKLFDKSGGAASGNKQDAVNGAAMTVMKLFVQSKVGAGGSIGGGNSGGLGSLMSLASKYVK